MSAAHTTSSRRLRSLIVSFDLVRDALLTGEHKLHYQVTKDPLPSDAVLVNVRYAWPNCIELVIWSSTFDELAEDAIAPPLQPEMTRQLERYDSLQECAPGMHR